MAEHALLAAQAVAEAEEASKKASSLLDAANELEDLDHHGLSARQGAFIARYSIMTPPSSTCQCSCVEL